MQLTDDMSGGREKRGRRKLKQKKLDRTLWRTRFGRGYEPVVTQTIK
jgi:hypothetical protein